MCVASSILGLPVWPIIFYSGDMAVRAPQSFAHVVNPKTGLSMVEAEMMAETAASLGHHGRKLEKALEALQTAAGDRRALEIRAGRATWEYFVQRELMGMRDHSLIVRELGIPQTVLNLMGVVGTR
jgi:hypothetical protein